MRRSTRQANPQGGAGPNAAHGPGTPQHPRTGDTLNEIIRQLECEFNLGLEVRSETWSPLKNDSSLANKIQGKIKRLYFSSEPALQQILDDFKAKAGNVVRGKRLELLHQLLRAQTSSPRSPNVPGSRSLRDESHKSLRAPPFRQTLISPLSNLYTHNDETESLFTTAPETAESSTEDDGEYSPPPSPTNSIRSAQRRGQTRSHIPFRSTERKRPSQYSEEDGSPPKLTRTAKREQSSPTRNKIPQIPKQPLFKMPSLEMARSYQVNSGQTSFTNSFNSTSLSSSQQTGNGPDTANTSFTSEAGKAFATVPGLTTTSSRTMYSLNNNNLREVTFDLENKTVRGTQDMTRESSSTFGSIDEDGLVNVTSKHEEEQLYYGYRGPIVKDASSSFRMVDSSSTQVQRPSTPQSNSSPVQFVAHSSRTDPKESPSRVPYYIRQLPEDNLFTEDLPRDLMKYPYFILFICQRIASHHKIPLRQLMHGMDPHVCDDYDGFQQLIKNHPTIPQLGKIQEPKRLWSTAKNGFDGYTFKGRASFNEGNTEPMFSLELLPIQAEKSCRFQRAFGADRFLYLSFPPWDTALKRRNFDRVKIDQLRSQWNEWFLHEHLFLGRKWRAFHIEPIKRGKGVRREDAEKFDKRVVLFATEGCGIKIPYSIGEMLNWFLSFSQNQHQSFCKAFARFDLGLSRTSPTIRFKRSQVRYVGDIRADGSPEDTRFNDPSLWWSDPNKRELMNDGCSVMSVGAAHEIWKQYKKDTGTNVTMPSAFQGRIGGAKGVWMISAESYSKDPHHQDIWIEISRSQQKFEPHPDDDFDETCDPRRLTFELVDYSRPAVHSDLHIIFIPILVDRGVPAKDIADLMNKHLDLKRQQLLEIISDPAKLYHWIYKEGWQTQEDEVRWQAGLPMTLDERLKLLLETGFSPLQSPYLAKCLHRFIRREQLWREQKLRIPLGKATFLYGVADPFGVLKPGEVHVQFSTPFMDEVADETYLRLDDLELLVARQPACRRSDIQKVRAITHSRLSHLIDVVVFPSKGQYPLAGKLQGGDYDGDIFWLCWEPVLVAPFKNAPAPVQPPDPIQYGIKTDTRKLYEVMNPINLTSVDDLIRKVIAFRTRPSFLGVVTTYLEKQAYVENRVHSDTLNQLCDMHDLLVDAPKSGYVFGDADWKRYITHFLRLPHNLEPPAYKAAMEACEKAKDIDEMDQARKNEFGFKKANVLDSLYFECIRAHNVETLRQVDDALLGTGASDPDPVLRYPYDRLREQNNPVINQELDTLIVHFKDIFRLWNFGMHSVLNSRPKSGTYNKPLNDCYNQFRSLTPIQSDHPEIKPWLTNYLHDDFTLWDTLKASALYSAYPWREKASFVFNMAGTELTKLKASNSPNMRAMIAPIHGNLRPKPMRASIQLEGNSSDEEFMSATEETQSV